MPFPMFAVVALAACGSTAAPVAPVAPAVPSAPMIVPVPEVAAAPPPPRALAVAQPALLDAPLPGDGAHVTIHRLSNGMTVYLSPDPTAATIVAHVVVHAGSSNDPADFRPGLAHYLEHMLFKGTEKLGTLDYAKEKPHLDKIAALYDELRGPSGDRDRDRILAAIDAESIATADVIVPNEQDSVVARWASPALNAYTNSDATVVHHRAAEEPARAVGARAGGSRSRPGVPAVLAGARGGVRGEESRARQPAGRVNETRSWRALYPQHGYGWSNTLGEIEHLKKPGLQRHGRVLRSLLRAGEHGDPARRATSIEVRAAGAREGVRRVRARAGPGRASRATCGRRAGARTSRSWCRRTRAVIARVPVPPENSPDAVALEVIDRLIADGTAGMLTRELLLPQKVLAGGSSLDLAREAGAWELWADQLAGQSSQDVEAELRAVALDVSSGHFTDDDLRGAILAFESSRERQIETSLGRVGLMENAFVHDLAWPDVVAQLARAKALTRDEVVRVAQKYLQQQAPIVVRKVVGTATPPKIAKPKITPFQVDPSRRSAFAAEVLAMPVDPIEPVSEVEGTDYVRGKLATGELVTVPNVRNGLFHLDYRYDFGRVDDRLACFALGLLDVSGAGDRSAEQVGRELYALGVTVSFACDKDHSWISLDGEDAGLEKALAIVRDWLAAPVLDDATVARARDQLRTARANAVANPPQIAAAAAAYALFGDDTQQLVDASDKQLAAATSDQMKKLVGRWLHLAHRTAYFGPRAAGAAKDVVALGDGKLATTARKPARYRPAGAVTALDQDTAQTRVSLWWPRPPASDAERAVGTLYYFYEGTLLYRDVREVRGLAYSVGGGWLPGARAQDDATAYAYIGTQADKTDDAIAAILDVLRAPIDDHRLAEAKQRIEEEHRVERVDPRRLAWTVYGWEDDGARTDPRDARARRVLAVDRAALGAWAKRVVAAKPLVSVVGRRAAVDEAKLAKLAPVTWVPVSRVFAY